jgi:hypothetical protein
LNTSDGYTMHAPYVQAAKFPRTRRAGKSDTGYYARSTLLIKAMEERRDVA